MDEQLKQHIEAQQRAFSAFREENDKGRKASEEKLAKIEGELSKLESLNQQLTQAALEAKNHKKTLEEIEAKVGRMALPAAGEARKQAAEERKAAFERWLRFGMGVEHRPETFAEMKGYVEKKALIASDDTAGGFLSPPEYIKEIVKAIVLISPVRSIVRVRPTTLRSAQVPKRTAVSSAAWVGETATRTESTNPSYGLMEIPTHELTAEHYVSMQEIEDSVFDVEAEINQEFAEQFAVAEGLAVVQGNGVAKPLGWLDAASGVATDKSGTAADIVDSSGTADPIVTLCYNVKEGYARNGVWTLNRQTLGRVRRIKDTHGQYIWAAGVGLAEGTTFNGLSGGLPNTILGYPYVEVPDMPAIGAGTKPIAFGDFRRAYTMVDRIAMSVIRDPYTKASLGQVKFVARRRVGGQVVLAEAIRTLTCST